MNIQDMLHHKMPQNPNEPHFPNVDKDNMPYDESKNKSEMKNNDLIDGDDIIIEESTIKKTPLESDAIMNNMNKNKNLRTFQQKIEMRNIKDNNKGDIKNNNRDIEEEPPNDNNGEVDYSFPQKLTRAQKLVHDKLKVPPRLFKTFIVTLVLAILGLTLIILGCIESIAEHTPGKGIMFWILGGVVMIPGGFYSYQFYQARKAKDEYERENIFDNIPEL